MFWTFEFKYLNLFWISIFKFRIFALYTALRERPVSYQLVGEVKAHQGYDG